MNILSGFDSKECYVDLRMKKARIEITNDVFEAVCLKQIAENFNFLIKNYKDVSLKLTLNIKSAYIADNPCIVILEQIIFYVIKNTNFRVHFLFYYDEREKSYCTNFLTNSILFRYRNKYIIDEDRNNLIEYFESCITSIDMDKKIFRRRIKYNSIDNSTTSKLMSDISTFLKVNIPDENVKEDIIEIISELASNMEEHGCADYIVQLQIMDNIAKVKKSLNGDTISGKILDLMIYNLSNNKLYTGMKRMLDEGYIESQKNFFEAYEFHKERFYEKYTLEDFLILSTFQKYISSRKNQHGTGGTGLTVCMQKLYDYLFIEHVSNYVLSGKSLFVFDPNYIAEKTKNYIGFNKTGNYLTDIPIEDAHPGTSFNYNGTLYYMELFIKEE